MTSHLGNEKNELHAGELEGSYKEGNKYNVLFYFLFWDVTLHDDSNKL